MAGIHAPYYTNVQSVFNTPKLIPYLNQGTQKIPAKIFFLQKNPGIENFNLPDRVMAQSIPSVPTPPPPSQGICHFCSEKLQIPHGGAGWFIQKPHGGVLRLCKCPTPGQQVNCNIQ